jgi:hypothetical protein
MLIPDHKGCAALEWIARQGLRGERGLDPDGRQSRRTPEWIVLEALNRLLIDRYQVSKVPVVAELRLVHAPVRQALQEAVVRQPLVQACEARIDNAETNRDGSHGPIVTGGESTSRELFARLGP